MGGGQRGQCVQRFGRGLPAQHREPVAIDCYDLYSCLRSIHGRCARFSHGNQHTGVFWCGFKGHIGGVELVELQISKTGVVTISAYDAADAFGADIAAQVLVGLPGRGLGAAAQDEAPCAAVLGIEGQHGVAGGTAAGKEIQHGVTGAGGLGQQVFNQRQGLGIGKRFFTHHVFKNARTFFRRSHHRHVFGRVGGVFLRARCQPGRNGRVLIFQSVLEFLQAWSSIANVLAHPKIQIRGFQGQQRRAATERHIALRNGRFQGLQG